MWLNWQTASFYYVAKSLIPALPFQNDAEKEQHEEARLKAAANLRRLNRRGSDDESDSEETVSGRGKPRRPRKEDLILDQYENQIAMEVVAPEDIPVGFDG